MSGISSIGGMTDLDTFISQSLAIEKKPIQELESSKSALRKKDLVYTDLKAKLRELNDITKDLIAVGVSNKLRAKKAESSDSKYFTAETTGSTSPHPGNIKTTWRRSPGNTSIRLHANYFLASNRPGKVTRWIENHRALKGTYKNEITWARLYIRLKINISDSNDTS